jgi:tRNA pseudouridine65 synthase
VHRTELDHRATAFAVQRLRDQLGRPVYPAHRLDRATSGVLLFALDPAVHARLAAAFEAGAVEKRYLAIVRGWPAEQLVIDHALTRLDEDAGGRAGGPPRAAQTALRRLATAELPVRVDRYPTSRYALVALEPRTGRRHQLRRHLTHIHHPIIGDTTYGQGRHNRLFRERFGSSRLLLHALAVRLAHPLSGAPLSIVAPPPPDFARVATALGFPLDLPAGA